MNARPVAPTARPAWFWIVATAALLWNLIGLSMFAVHYSMGPEQLAALPAGERQLLDSAPAWAWAAYGLAVVAGSLASLALLLRRRLAVPLYWISLAAVLVQFAWTAVISGAPAILGAGALAMPVAVVAVAVLLVWFSHRAARRGWIA
ncbi:MAG: hypothetical protein ACLGHW_00380 [Gammaproteobacteria bacterium]|jgi:hypothetical protein